MSDMKIPTGGPLAPLQLHGGPEQVWRDSTWSTQGEAILAPPRRTFESNQSAGILRLVSSIFFFSYLIGWMARKSH